MFTKIEAVKIKDLGMHSNTVIFEGPVVATYWRVKIIKYVIQYVK